MLTAGQVAHYETFGFLVLRQLFTPAEVSTMRREAEKIFEDERGGLPFVGETQDIVAFLERKPYLSTLLDDDRVYQIGEDLLGDDFILHATSGALRVGDTRWHADQILENPLIGANISFYTEPLTKETGCLRVIPGSQLTGSPDLLAPLRSSDKDPDFRPFGMRPSELACYSYESEPGDVIVFTAKLLHAAFGSKVSRQMHLISLYSNPKTEEEMAAIRALYEISRWGLHPAESYVNSDRPRIRRAVSRLVEWGFETLPV